MFLPVNYSGGAGSRTRIHAYIELYKYRGVIRKTCVDVAQRHRRAFAPSHSAFGLYAQARGRQTGSRSPLLDVLLETWRSMVQVASLESLATGGAL